MVCEVHSKLMVVNAPVPEDFTSNGCTVPWWLALLTLGLLPLAMRPYKEACRWHDWARRHLVHHRVLSVQQADNGFREYLIVLGAWRWFARLVWLFVKLTRSRYSRTLPVPMEWEKYLKPRA